MFSAKQMLSKVPEVTFYFWLIKVLCTTTGETFADDLTANLGFGGNTLYFVGVLTAVALAVQFKARRYVAPIYWLAVVLISVFGTLITDKLTDDYGVKLTITTTVFTIGLLAVFAVWYAQEKTLSIHSITTTRREAFYWLAILVTFALGTAAGDLIAEEFKIGYFNSIILFSGVIAIITIAHYGLGLNAVVAFWGAYVVTRPLGASIGDWLSQDTIDGGLGLGPNTTSVIFLTAILALVVYLTITKKDAPRPIDPADARQPISPGDVTRRGLAAEAGRRLMPTTIESIQNNKLLGWAGIVGVAVLTAVLMLGASAVGLSKSPTTETLAEEYGGGSAADVPEGPSSATVDVTLSEWSIEPSVSSVKAGVITFNVHNAGPDETHECIILKTDIAPESLPTLDDNSLDEEGDGITSPGESHVLDVGEDQEVKVEMTQGNYIFVDNVVEDGTVHWEKRAYATFTVEPAGETPTP